MGSERFEIGTDLVADIPGTGGSIRADDTQVDFAVLHQVAAGIISDHRVGDAVSAQFPCCQRGTLIAWPCFVYPNMHRDALIMGLEDRREGCAPIDSGKPARIAVCEDIDRPMRAGVRRFRNKRQPVVADSAIGGNILVADLLGEFPGTVCTLRFGDLQ